MLMCLCLSNAFTIRRFRWVGSLAGALFLWDEAAVELSASELQADAAYVVLAHGASQPHLRVRGLLTVSYHRSSKLCRDCA